MYADRVTDSMAAAIDETNRRRDKQIAYNTAAGVDPMPLRKRIGDITEMLAREDADTAQTLDAVKKATPTRRAGADSGEGTRPADELAALIEELSEQMRIAAGELHFEIAARLRDEIAELKKELRQMLGAG